MLFANSSNSARNVRKETRVDKLCVVDQFDAQDFNLNSAGWTRNDICQLARAQTQQEYDAIMKRLNIIPDAPGNADGKSRLDAINGIKSRYCQSAVEIEQYAQIYSEDEQRRLSAAYQVEKEKQVVEDTEASQAPSEGNAE